MPPEQSWWDKLTERIAADAERMENLYVDPDVSKFARDVWRQTAQYYSEPPPVTEDVKKYGGIRAPRASDDPAGTMSDVLGSLPQGALAKMGGYATAKMMLPFAGSANDVYKDLTRYKKYGRDAIPPGYTDRQSPLWHTINHDALTNRTSIGPEALDARTKETADTILQMYYGEGKGYGKVPQLDPDLSFGGVDQFDLIPLKPGTSGHAYTALKSEQGTKDYYDNIRRFYMPKILSKHGSIPNHSALIAVDPIQKPTDEMMRRLGLAEIIEHESAHGRLIQGRLTEDELPAYDYIRRASEGEGGRRLPSEATSMRTNLPYKGEEFSNNFHEVRNQLIREIHDALAKDPNMVQYQNWDNVRPRDISFQAHDTQFRGDAGGSWDWASNPEEMLASTIGVGRAAPGMVVNPAIREADDTAISRFLRLNQIR